MLNMNTRLVGLKDSHIIWYNNTLDRGLINDSKGNVKIVFEWRCGADWPGQRRGVKHLHPCKIKVQVTAVTRPCITSNPLFNGRVFSKSCPRNQYFQIITVN